MEFTNELIGQLTTCPKEIVQFPGKPRLERGYYRIGFELQSVDQEFFSISKFQYLIQLFGI